MLKRRLGYDNRQQSVIQRSKATWESPKYKRKHSGGCHWTALVLAITNRATTLNSQNEMDKNSNHNSVRVLAWYLACLHASGYNVHLFKVYLLTECAYLKCEPQGGENMSAELDEKYENAWHSVA